MCCSCVLPELHLIFRFEVTEVKIEEEVKDEEGGPYGATFFILTFHTFLTCYLHLHVYNIQNIKSYRLFKVTQATDKK